jgi:hypothetical protein
MNCVSGKQVADIAFAREGGSDRKLEKTAKVKLHIDTPL